MCLWATLHGERDPRGRGSMSPLVTLPIPVLKKQDVKNGQPAHFLQPVESLQLEPEPSPAGDPWQSREALSVECHFLSTVDMQTRKHFRLHKKTNLYAEGTEDGQSCLHGICTWQPAVVRTTLVWVAGNWVSKLGLYTTSCVTLVPLSVRARSWRGWHLSTLWGLKSPTSQSCQDPGLGVTQAWFNLSSTIYLQVAKPLLSL